MTLGSGIAPALIAAILFGASTPLARALIGAIDPAWLAGCLYAGSGLGLSALYALRRAGGNAKRISPLTRRDLPWLAATIASAGSDALSIAMAKGLCGGGVNLALAAALAGPPPAPVAAIAAGVVGFLGYGVSLVLFVVALRHLGTARASAYYATAPFIGVAVAFAVLAERPGSIFWVALPLMALGVWLHLTERHAHLHSHEAMVHDHPHEHDEHHRHAHDFPWDGTEPHAHPHTHEQVTHAHAHFPDAHHRHGH